MAVLTMDSIGKLDTDDFVYVVVQTSVPYIANVATSYSEARRLRTYTPFESVILALQPETLQAIQNGELREIII